MAQKIVTHQFLSSVAACTLGCWIGSYQSVYAETQDFVINIPIYNPVVYGDLISQAESRVGTVIVRQFSQNPRLSNIQVAVIGDRHGELMPILTTTVSRAQWQSNPRVNPWTKYYDTSYALIRRHDIRKPEVIAAAPTRDRTPNFQSPIQRQSFSIDAAFDSGKLTGSAAQEYLNRLD